MDKPEYLLPNEIKLAVLKLIDRLMEGAEKSITDPDDYSGVNTEYLLDSERFRRNIQKEIEAIA